MSSPVPDVDPSSLHPTLNTNSNPTTSSPSGYVSLLESCETPG